MGCGASSDAHSARSGDAYAAPVEAPLTPLRSWQPEDVVLWLRSLGHAFEAYVPIVQRGSLRGSDFLQLASMLPQRADAKLQAALRIPWARHRQAILDSLRTLITRDGTADKDGMCASQLQAVMPATGARGHASMTAVDTATVTTAAAPLPNPHASALAVVLRDCCALVDSVTARQHWLQRFKSFLDDLTSELAAATPLFRRESYTGRLLAQLQKSESLLLDIAMRDAAEADLHSSTDERALAARREVCERMRVEELTAMLAACTEDTPEIRETLQRSEASLATLRAERAARDAADEAAAEAIEQELAAESGHVSPPRPSPPVAVVAAPPAGDPLVRRMSLRSVPVEPTAAAAAAVTVPSPAPFSLSTRLPSLRCPIVALTGAPGCGKSEMALHFARQHLGEADGEGEQQPPLEEGSQNGTDPASSLQVASVALPSRISNLPPPCAHFIPRPAIMELLCADFAVATATVTAAAASATAAATASVVADCAAATAITPVEPDSSTNNAVAHASDAHVPHKQRLCWLIRAESADSIRAGFKQLCAAFRVEWRTEMRDVISSEGKALPETSQETFARVCHSLYESIQRYDALILFDGASAFDTLSPFLPTDPAVQVRILVTSTNEGLLLPSAAEGRFVHSLSGGLSEEEALGLMGAVGGARHRANDGGDGAGPGTDASREEQLKLITELDRLPLAIATASYCIACENFSSSHDSAPRAAPYGATDLARELVWSDLVVLRKGQSATTDPPRSLAALLQVAIGKTKPAFRSLLEYAALLDASCMPLELLQQLYDGQARPRSSADDQRRAELAFIHMLSSPANLSLLRVDSTHQRVHMHRSTQLQVAVLIEARCATEETALPTGTSADAPALMSRGSSRWDPEAPSSRASHDAALRVAPSRLQQWKVRSIGEVLTAVATRWPAREEDAVSVLGLEALPTIVHLVDECASLPMLHAELAPLHAQLMRHMQLLMLHLEVKQEWATMQRLAAAALKLCEPSSEAAHAIRFWDTVALAGSCEPSEAALLFQTLFDTLLASHPHDWLELRVRVALRVAELRQSTDPTAALSLCEQCMSWLQQLLGDKEHLLLARLWHCAALMHMQLNDASCSLQCVRNSLAVAERVCGPDSAQAGLAHFQSAMATKPFQQSQHHYAQAIRIYDRVYAAFPRRSHQVLLWQIASMLMHDQKEAALRLLRARLTQLMRAPGQQSDEGEEGPPGLGDSALTISLLLDAARVLSEWSLHGESLAWTKHACDLSERVHGLDHAHTLELMSLVALRMHTLSSGSRAATVSFQGSQVLSSSASAVRARIMSVLPRVRGRFVLVLAKLRSCVGIFHEMSDSAGAVLLAQHALRVARTQADAWPTCHAEHLDLLAGALGKDHRFAEGVDCYKQALRLFADSGKLVRASGVAKLLGDTCQKQGDSAGELEARSHALQLALQAAGDASVLAARQHRCIADLYTRRLQWLLALTHRLIDLRIRQLVGPPDSKALSTAAEQAVSTCKRMFKTRWPPTHAQLASLLQSVGAALPSDKHALAHSTTNLAQALLGAGQQEEGAQMQREAKKLMQAMARPATRNRGK